MYEVLDSQKICLNPHSAYLNFFSSHLIQLIAPYQIYEADINKQNKKDETFFRKIIETKKIELACHTRHIMK